jgi:hypothetical protein
MWPKKRNQTALYETGIARAGSHNSAPAPGSCFSPYDGAKALLTQEEISLLVLSNNFLSAAPLQCLETDASFETAFRSSYELERGFLEHYVSRVKPRLSDNE